MPKPSIRFPLSLRPCSVGASLLIAACLGVSSSAHAQNAGQFFTETSFSRTETFVDTEVTRRLDLFSTRLLGRIDGDPTYYVDQTYLFAFAGPSVQAGVLSAQQILSGLSSDPLAFDVPALLASSTGLVSTQSSMEIVQSSVQGTQVGAIVVFGDVGGSTLPYGDLGVCQVLLDRESSDIVAEGVYPFGCSGGSPSILEFFGGDTAVVVNTNTDYLITRNLVATDTYLTSATYEIVGRVSSGPAPVPLPATGALLVIGLAAALAASRRSMRRESEDPPLRG